MKRIFFAFLGVLSLYISANADTATIDGYTWTYVVHGNTAEVTFGTPKTNYITIPETLGGKPVTSIGGSAFKGWDLWGVTIPDTVTSIGSSAFAGCSNLFRVTIGKGVKCISMSAFEGCKSLESLRIPDSVTSIDMYAFRNCSESLFDTATIKGVKLIDGWVVGNTGSLTGDLDLKGVRGVGAQSFYGCRDLTGVSLPDSMVGIGDMTFYSCSGLTHVTIPAGVVSIGRQAFKGCSNLMSVTIPDSVELVGFEAFDGCSSKLFDTTTLPGVKLVDGWAVGNTGILSGDLDLTGIRGIGGRAFDDCKELTSVIVPNDVKSIGPYAFWDCSELTSVTMPDSVTVIAYGAFNGCSKLMNVTLPTRLNSIGSGAFEACHGLSSIVIPDGVTSIESYAFADCGRLTSVMIPDSVAEISCSAFSDCSSLTNVYLSSCYTDSLYVFPDGANITRYKSRQIVSLDANGGVIEPGFINVNYGSLYGDMPNPVREGYNFLGWKLGSGDVDSLTVVTALQDHTLNAQWQINQYTVTFDANGGTGGKTVTQDYGTAITKPANPTRTGYTFMGWSPSVPTTMPAENMTCTAQWKINQYMVTFDSAGGTTVSPITQDYATAITKPADPTRTGYAFIGWSPSVPSTMPAGNVTCKAQWKIRQYTVSFDSAGGTSVSPVKQDYGAAIAKPADPTRTGYTFMGWSPSVPATMPATSMTCTAQWQVKQYTVTFDPNGGTVSPATKIVTFDDVYGTLPIPQRKYCIFVRWKLGDKAVAKTVKVATASDHTLVAQWSRYGAEFTASQVAGKKLCELYPDDYANLTTIVLKDGITELPEGFFEGCDKVEFVTWPSTLLEFGIDDLPSKIRATVEGRYDADGFLIYNNWILDYQNRSAGSVTIPEGIVGVGRGAFAAMFDLETVTMPESLRCIAKGAFEDCSWIQDLQFMSGLRYVGPFAFRGCSSLLRATFADGVKQIGANAFADCWKMISVHLPFTVTNIGVNAFSGCSAIRGVTVPTQVETMQTLFPVAYTKIETAEVAEGETVVMDDMFSGCVALRGGATQMAQTHLSMIPNTVTNIGARAFQGCTSLTDVVVPNSVLQVGVSVFEYCSSLTNMTLSINLSAIPDRAFKGCSKLDSMKVPANVCYLGKEFFCGKDLGVNALYYLCTNAPSFHSDAYAAITGDMTTYVLHESRGWDGHSGSPAPPKDYMWNGYPWKYWTALRFDVTFDANGGRFDSSGGSTWSEQQITDTPYALPSTEPIRPGWAFEGWWTEPTGGAEVRYTTKVTATRSFTLYAHWRSLGNTVTVTFNSNGGTVVTPGTQDYVPGQTFGQFPEPTRRGYTFQGWWTEAAGGDHMTEATAVPAADMELFAHWSPITYVVRFHANGGNGGDVDQTFVFDVQKALASHTFTRTGFAFTGWAATPGGQVRYAENAKVVNLEEVQDKVVDLYAVWSGVGYSVRFDSNGGTGIMDNQTIAVDETQNLWPCVFARAGYTFVGWAVSPTEAETKTVKYRDGQAVRNLATSNGATVTLYAVWVAKSNTVRITFDANGGSVAPGYWDCVVDTAVESFPTPTRPGFTYAGWWTKTDGGTRVYSIARVTSEQTFYAHWTANGGSDPGDGSYTVTFNANGGSVAPASRTVAGGSAVGTLPNPVRAGYRCLGWFTAASGGVEVSATTEVTGKVTYYAHWQPVYAIRFHRNDASDEKTEAYDFDYGVEKRMPSLKSLGWGAEGLRFPRLGDEPGQRRRGEGVEGRLGPRLDCRGGGPDARCLRRLGAEAG